MQKYSLSTVMQAAESAPPALDFISALRLPPQPSLVGEIKRASPSKGVLLADFDPLRLAELYTANGARAVSVLTDQEYFQGYLEDLVRIRQQFPSLPLLRKDFIYHPYQIYEARAAGADAILLITAGLDPLQLADLYTLAGELGMSALVEVHTRFELEQALSLQPRLVGINNRDLHTFHTNLDVTHELSRYIPPGVCLVSESGIRSAVNVKHLVQAGVHSILVGEALITASDPAAMVRELAFATYIVDSSGYPPGSSLAEKRRS